jgi:hypothetical protein
VFSASLQPICFTNKFGPTTLYYRWLLSTCFLAPCVSTCCHSSIFFFIFLYRREAQ